MPDAHEPRAISDEQMEQYVLGSASPVVHAEIASRLHTDAALAQAHARAQKECAQLRAALSATHHTNDDPTREATLVAYLDDALSPEDRSQLEQQLSTDPQLLATLVALHREVNAAADPASEPMLAEKFLAGETVPFVKREPDATTSTPSTYVELTEAVEERKRRYLQFGN